MRLHVFVGPTGGRLGGLQRLWLALSILLGHPVMLDFSPIDRAESDDVC